MASSGSLLTQAEVSVGAVATLIAAANADRDSVIIRNIGDDGGVVVFVGDSAVATTDGMPIENGTATGRRGESVTIRGSAAIYGIVAAGTQDVRVIEVTD